MSLLRRLAAGLVLVPALAVPFAYGEGVTYDHHAVKDFAALTAATVLAAAGLASWRPRRLGETDADPSSVYAPLLFLVVWAAFTLFWHSHRWAAAATLAQWTMFAAGSLGLSLLAARPGFRRWLIAAYGVAVAGAALAYFKVYRMTPLGGGDHFPFANPNVGASFLVGPAVAAAILCAHYRLRRQGPACALAAAVLFASLPALYRTGAKGAWIGGAAGLASGFWALFPRCRRYLLAAAPAAALALALVLSLRPGAAADVRRSIDVRLQMWRGTWTMIAETPLHFLGGRGAGSFLPEYPRFEPISSEVEDQWAEFVVHPHNIVLETWSELGLAGVLLLAGLGAAILAALRRGLRHRTDPADRAVLAASAAALVALFVHGLLDIALLVPAILWQAAIALALVAALGRPPDPGREPGAPLPRRVLALSGGVRLAAALCLAALWWTAAVPALRSEIDHHRAHEAAAEARALSLALRRERARDLMEQAVEIFDRALATAPWESYDTVRMRLGRARALIDLASWSEDPGRRVESARRAYAEFERVAGQAEGLVPSWGLGDHRLAVAAIVMGEPRLAAEHIHRGSSRRPAQWQYYWLFNLERPLLEGHARPRELSRNLERGLSLGPDSFPLYAQYALFAAAEDPDRAAGPLARAEELWEALDRGSLGLKAQEYDEIRAQLAAAGRRP